MKIARKWVLSRQIVRRNAHTDSEKMRAEDLLHTNYEYCALEGLTTHKLQLIARYQNLSHTNYDKLRARLFLTLIVS